MLHLFENQLKYGGLASFSWNIYELNDSPADTNAYQKRNRAD